MGALDDLPIQILQLIVSALLGAVVGWEREGRDRPAGLRTNMLVCVGATLITQVSHITSENIGDPGRIAAQIVSGIGFLGAGTILRQGSVIRGLTSAASLWAVAGVGMAVGTGPSTMVLATVATLVIWVTLRLFQRVEPRLRTIHRRDLLLSVGVETVDLAPVIQGLGEFDAEVRRAEWLGDAADARRQVRLTLVLSSDTVAAISGWLALQPTVHTFEWV